MATMRWRDKALVKRILSGDKMAGERFVSDHYTRIYRFLRYLTGRVEDAEDLTQQTFLQAWEKLSSFKGESSLATWLHSIAYHEYTHWLRSRREHAPLEEAIEIPDERTAHELEAVLLRCALMKLSTEHREAFILYHVQGLSVQEIAAMLGVPAGTVKSRLFFARHRLQELLQGSVAMTTARAVGKPKEVFVMAVRIAEVTVTPSPLKVGSQATAKCRVDADSAVRRVYALLPGGMVLNFHKVSDAEFELTEQVPWDAPLGTYPITVVAETETGERATLATSVTIA